MIYYKILAATDPLLANIIIGSEEPYRVGDTFKVLEASFVIENTIQMKDAATMLASPNFQVVIKRIV